MILSEIAERFQHAKKSGSSWSALCPLHDDQQASLSVSQGDKGIVVYCHVCGTEATATILKIAGLAFSDLFENHKTQSLPAFVKIGPVVAEYLYRDLSGVVVHRVTRHEPKTFRQWKPNMTTVGSLYIPGTDGVTKVLYRLNESIGSKVVFIVEGEKDVDALMALAVPTTCNVGGASNWDENYIAQLKEAGVERVVVIPDNDVAGKKHSLEITETCVAGGIRVKLVELQGLHDKGDVSDWLAEGHTKADLYGLVGSTAIYVALPIPKALPPTAETIEAVERCLIGSVIINSIKFPPLHAHEFLNRQHRVIWQGMREMYGDDKVLSAVTLAHHIESHGFWLEYLLQCVNEAKPDAITTMARQVRESGKRAAAKRIGTQMVTDGLSPDQAQAKLDELPGPLTGAIYDPAVNWLSIQERWKAGVFLKTGFWQLDENAPLALGEFIIIGGRTSHGKTALAKTIARRIAEHHVKVEYITLEETADSITRREIADIANVPNYKIKAGPPPYGLLTSQEFDLCDNAVITLQDIDLTVTALDTISALDADTVVGCVSNSDAQVIFLDHIQKVSTKGDSRAYGIEEVVNRLHRVAIKQNKAIIVLWQFNREMDKEGRRPVIADLRDSGAGEIAARQIWLLCWPMKLNLPAKEHDVIDPEDYEVWIAKQSDFGTAMVNLRFNMVTGSFSDAEAKPAIVSIDFSQSTGVPF